MSDVSDMGKQGAFDSMRELYKKAETQRALIAELVEAGDVLLNGLYERIRQAPEGAVPVFEGIALFEYTLTKAREALK